jgi:hypothetical protein
MFKKGCPRPVCDPCTLEHAGYYAACWKPWPYPPDWSHCPVPPPSALVAPPGPPVRAVVPIVPAARGPTGPLENGSDLPPPRALDEGLNPTSYYQAVQPPAAPVVRPVPRPGVRIVN